MEKAKTILYRKSVSRYTIKPFLSSKLFKLQDVFVFSLHLNTRKGCFNFEKTMNIANKEREVFEVAQTIIYVVYLAGRRPGGGGVAPSWRPAPSPLTRRELLLQLEFFLEIMSSTIFMKQNNVLLCQFSTCSSVWIGSIFGHS